MKSSYQAHQCLRLLYIFTVPGFSAIDLHWFCGHSDHLALESTQDGENTAQEEKNA